jgi:hypothetical protein
MFLTIVYVCRLFAKVLPPVMATPRAGNHDSGALAIVQAKLDKVEEDLNRFRANLQHTKTSGAGRRASWRSSPYSTGGSKFPHVPMKVIDAELGHLTEQARQAKEEAPPSEKDWMSCSSRRVQNLERQVRHLLESMAKYADSKVIGSRSQRRT